jgi:predicted deacylase
MTGDGALRVGPIVAEPGSRRTAVAAVDLGAGQSVDVPLLVINGAEPGPRVGVTAGIHGAEYVSIAALRRVVLGLEPANVRGSIVAVLTANPVAFQRRSIYVDPIDGVNLNRVFPGKADGGATERLARWITDTVIAGSDVYVDMHCGDMNEALVSFTGIEDIGDPEVDQRTRALAKAYGLRYMVVGPSPGMTTGAAAALGIPAVLGEVGGQGRWPEADVDLHAAGFQRLLKVAGLIDEAPTSPAFETEVLGNEAWMRSSASGYWHPAVEVGALVRAGDSLGEVQDAFGLALERPVAPIDGVVIFLVTSLAMNAGDPLLAVAG